MKNFKLLLATPVAALILSSIAYGAAAPTAPHTVAAPTARALEEASKIAHSRTLGLDDKTRFNQILKLGVELYDIAGVDIKGLSPEDRADMTHPIIVRQAVLHTIKNNHPDKTAGMPSEQQAYAAHVLSLAVFMRDLCEAPDRKAIYDDCLSDYIMQQQEARRRASEAEHAPRPAARAASSRILNPDNPEDFALLRRMGLHTMTGGTITLSSYGSISIKGGSLVATAGQTVRLGAWK